LKTDYKNPVDLCNSLNPVSINSILQIFELWIAISGLNEITLIAEINSSIILWNWPVANSLTHWAPALLDE
jgi:hypothetical protein